MRFYSFENLKVDNSGHYNLFEKTMVKKSDVTYNRFITTDEFNGRLDLICYHLYGTTSYIEELMTINNIINPFSIKTNTIILYPSDLNVFGSMYESDPTSNDAKDTILQINRSKTTIKDQNRIGSPPTIKPDNIKQVDINYANKKITIINKLK